MDSRTVWQWVSWVWTPLGWSSCPSSWTLACSNPVSHGRKTRRWCWIRNMAGPELDSYMEMMMMIIMMWLMMVIMMMMIMMMKVMMMMMMMLMIMIMIMIINIDEHLWLGYVWVYLPLLSVLQKRRILLLVQFQSLEANQNNRPGSRRFPSMPKWLFFFFFIY